MNRTLLFSLTLLLSVGLCAQIKSKAPSRAVGLELPTSYRELLSKTEQALVVTTPNWNSVDGTLTRYDKQGGKWQQVGEKIPVTVAKNGLAWDGAIDLPKNMPQKHEGDGRSPAGVFPVSTEFGFAPTASNSKMPYVPLTDATECVDDANSRSYTKIVDSSQISYKDWDSSEKMRQIDQYRLGAVVDYNPDAFTGAGSCIFLHIWNGPGHGTAGCTAMDQSKLADTLNWLDSSKNPVLVQMPVAVYRQLRGTWELP